MHSASIGMASGSQFTPTVEGDGPSQPTMTIEDVEGIDHHCVGSPGTAHTVVAVAMVVVECVLRTGAVVVPGGR